jgi:ArsR family transcriptional regulator
LLRVWGGGFLGDLLTGQAKVFKALSDENRLMILEILRRGEKCACHLLEDLPIGQSTLSHHMNILCESELVVAQRSGKWTHYSINPEGSDKAVELLKILQLSDD